MAITKSEYIDTGLYKIDTNKEIVSLSSKFAKAYEITDSNYSEEKREMYALVFDSNYPINKNLLSSLQKGNTYGIPKVISQGILKHINKDSKLYLEKYCAILEKPIGIPLKEYVLKEGRLNNSFEALEFVSRLIKLVLDLHEKNLVHACINHENVFVDYKTGRVCLKEFFSEYPGFSQKPEYEQISQVILDDAAKNYTEYQIDYYAIGVVAAFVIMKREIIKESGNKELVIIQKLLKGSIQYVFDFLPNNITVPARIANLFRGVLNDEKENIWNKKKLDLWLKGSEVTFQTSNVHRETLTPFEFNEKRYYSIKHLAYAIFNKKEIARKTLNLIELHRWINNFLREKEKAEEIQFIYKNKNSTLLTIEHVFKIIMILDSDNICFEDKLININGIRNFFIKNYSETRVLSTNFLKRLLDSGMIDFWFSLHSSGLRNKESHIFDTKSIRHFFNIKSIGFGSERAIYSLTKDLACQSSVFADYYIVSKRQLLETLDKMLASGKKINFDDNDIAAYLTNQLNITDEMQIKSLRQFQHLSRHNILLMNLYLTLAQNDIGKIKLPHLTSWAAKNLDVILAFLHNNITKKLMSDKLINYAREGDIAKLHLIVTNPRYIRKDKAKFNLARKSYNNLSKKLFVLSDKNLLRKKSIIYGLIVSAKLAYVICIITVLYSFLRLF